MRCLARPDRRGKFPQLTQVPAGKFVANRSEADGRKQPRLCYLVGLSERRMAGPRVELYLEAATMKRLVWIPAIFVLGMAISTPREAAAQAQRRRARR